MPHSLETLGLKIPHIYLPENTRALDTWCVIAYDQYTSDPAYWGKCGARGGRSAPPR